MNDKPVINVPEKDAPREPHTKQEIYDDAHERISLIGQEFKKAFAFLKNYPKSVTFFGGTKVAETDPSYISARSLAHRIAAELQYPVFTGGGPGITEAANRGALEGGGKSVGLTIELVNHQIKNQYLTESLDFYYFFSRKVCMSFSAEAYIFFPGGFGTLDEFYEIITLVQTKKIEKVPIICFGSEFWGAFHELMKKEMLNRGTVDTQDLSLYTITDNEDEVLEIIRNAPIREDIKFTHHPTVITV